MSINKMSRISRCLAATALTRGPHLRLLPESRSYPQAERISRTCRHLHSSATRRDAQQPSFEELKEAVPELSGLPASTDLLELYRGMATAGKLRWDDEQVRCIIKVRALSASGDAEYCAFRYPIDLVYSQWGSYIASTPARNTGGIRTSFGAAGKAQPVSTLPGPRVIRELVERQQSP